MALVRSVWFLLALCGCVCGAAAAQTPGAALVQAVQQTNAAASTMLVLSERIEVGAGIVTTLRMSGTEEPRTGKGSFLYDVTPDTTGLGEARIVVDGATDYVHYGLLDTLHASNPSVKSWVVIKTATSLGFDPAGLASLGVREVPELTGLRIAGTGTDAGLPVTRYVGTLALSKLANSKEIKALLASVPSEAAALLKGTETLEISVGSDGFIHHVDGVLEAPLGGGTSLEVAIDGELSNFDSTGAAISAPPASQVMTLEQFQRAAKSTTAVPVA